MHRRLLVTVLLGVGVALSVVTPARAKGATDARITGPNLVTPIRVPAENIASLADATAATALLFSHPSGLELKAATPGGNLGPAYRVRYAMGDQVLLEQQVHPYAAGGAVVFVPPGQHNVMLDRPFETGWTKALPGLTDRLVTLGLPRQGAPVEPSPTAAAPPAIPAPRSIPAGIIGGAAAAAALLLGAGIWLGRRRRVAQA